MANNEQPNNRRELIVEQDLLTLNNGAQNPTPLEDLPQNFTGNNGTNRFGVVRDRLFHVMLVKMALSYSRRCSYLMRRLFEVSTFLTAVTLLFLLVYVNFIYNQYPGKCLETIKENWPKKGVVRVEVIENLQEYLAIRSKTTSIDLYLKIQAEKYSNDHCYLNQKHVFIFGPIALPDELKNGIKLKHKTTLSKISNQTISKTIFETAAKDVSHDGGGILEIVADENSWWWTHLRNKFSILLRPFKILLDAFEDEDEEEENDGEFGTAEVYLNNNNNDDDEYYEDHLKPSFVYVIEYSLHHGLVRLSQNIRQEYGIPTLLVQLDADSDECFANWKNKFLMRYLIGIDDIIMQSVRSIAENETDKGYLRDMINGENYHFVSLEVSRVSYLTALVVMLVFTFAISMLLRFSHHQIFLFIVDLLQMFELNQPLVFPVAPLLTVILALVGMEAIMSEIFHDTHTAFYVILLVWIADQFDAICCHSSIAKRYWLRFFYLYHYAFYAYQYRFNGQYSNLALLTSSCFILHSMIFFFHHYELPLIIYQERLQRIVNDLQHNNVNAASTTLNVSISMRENRPTNPTDTSSTSNQTSPPTTNLSNRQSGSRTIHHDPILGDTNGLTRLSSAATSTNTSSTTTTSTSTAGSIVSCAIRIFKRRNNNTTTEVNQTNGSHVGTSISPPSINTHQNVLNQQPSNNTQILGEIPELLRAGEQTANSILDGIFDDLTDSNNTN